MFISRQKAFLTAVLCLATRILPSNAKENISFIIDETHLADTLHTQLYASSQSLPSSDELQIASVCFINDTKKCNDKLFGGTGNNDYEMSDRDRCYNEDFTVGDCPEWYAPVGKKCPYGPYYSDCISTCPSSYVTYEALIMALVKPAVVNMHLVPVHLAVTATTIPQSQRVMSKTERAVWIATA